jgi:hypothetical protein
VGRGDGNKTVRYRDLICVAGMAKFNKQQAL